MSNEKDTDIKLEILEKLEEIKGQIDRIEEKINHSEE